MESLACSVVGKVVEVITEEIINKMIINQFRYVFRYTSILEDYWKEYKDLVDVQDNLEIEVNRDKNNGHRIKETVEEWLGEVETILIEHGQLVDEINDTEGWFMSSKVRYRLSRKLKKKTVLVVELKNRRPSGSLSYPLLPPLNAWARGLSNFTTSKASDKAFNNIMDWLKNDKDIMIGLHGMGGIGKTTLVKQIGKIAFAENIFEKVIIVVFSQSPDIKGIQDKIANQLELRFEDENDVISRANQLFQRLEQEKNILLILDNVWNVFNLSDYGLQHDASQNRRKYIITTRDSHICSSMSLPKPVPHGFMTESEAWDLFKKNAGLDDDWTMTDTARKVAEWCGGLPIAIVTLASALKGNSKSQWEASLIKLNNYKLLYIDNIDAINNPYICLEFSYNELSNEGIKLCFLLCSLYPEDYEIPIEDLVILATTEFKGDYSIEQKRSLVEGNIDTLVARCLLLKVERKTVRTHDMVKMHDVVRSFALSKLTKPDNFFTAKCIDESNKFQSRDVFAPSMAISVVTEQVTAIPSGLISPELRMLLLRCKSGSKGWEEPITKTFFGGMEALDNLSICAFRIEALPEFLINLQVLRLDHCKLDGDMSFLRYLSKVEIFSIRRSNISKLPNELSEMKNLKSLDVSYCRDLKEIPRGLIERLLKLEELYAHGVEYNLWGEDSSKASFSELNRLTCLKILSLEFEMKDLPKDFIFPNLKRYAIDSDIHGTRHNFTGPTKFLFTLFDKQPKYISSNTLTIMAADSTGLNAFRNLLSTVQHLDLDDIKCTISFEHYLRQGLTLSVGFINLTTMNVASCNKLTYLFSNSLAQSLVQLQTLYIKNCSVLESIIFIGQDDGRVIASDHNQSTMFRKLRIIDISFCPKLKYIMPISVARCLENLERISEVHNDLTQLFGPEEEEGSSLKIVLPQLTHLGCSLGHHFQRISCPSLQNLQLWDLPFVVDRELIRHVKLWRGDTFVAIPCENERVKRIIFTNPLFQNLEGLDEVCHHDCLGNKEPHSLKNIVLRNIWSGCIYTCNLTSLTVTQCHSLNYILSPTMVRNLPNLEKLSVSQCHGLVEIIGEDNSGDTKIVLPLLMSLELSNLPNLRSFSPLGYHCILPILNKIHVKGCDNLAISFTCASLDGSVHAQTKDYSQRLGQVFERLSTKDLPPYLSDGSSSSTPQDPQPTEGRNASE